jgi:peptide/nickel transport system permease protein
MIGYIARRLAFAVVLVFAVSSASLMLARFAPGDYVAESLGATAKREAVEAARARYGLNRSFGQQYREWLSGVVRLDFGRSMQYDRPVAELIPQRALNTGILAVAALTLATLVGLPLGIITGTGRRGVVPATIRGISLVLLSMPPLLTSLFLVFVASKSGVLPVGGMTSTDGDQLLRHMVVPVAALALPLAAMFERLQSQAMAETVSQPYVLATLSRGVSITRVIWRDALKNALRPIASIYGLVIGTLLSGSFAVEAITAWPGLGQLMLGALRARDVYLVAGCAAAGSVFLAIGTLLSDAMLAAVDPRARES